MTASTLIDLMPEPAAMHAVGIKSAGMFTYCVVGDGAQTVLDWVVGQDLHMEMIAHWDQGRLRAAYVMFARAAHSEERTRNVNDALCLFRQAWKGVEGIQWRKEPQLAKCVRV